MRESYDELRDRLHEETREEVWGCENLHPGNVTGVMRIFYEERWFRPMFEDIQKLRQQVLALGGYPEA